MPPSLVMVASNRTGPSIRIWRAAAGYLGCTFFRTTPCVRPCEMLGASSTGVGEALLPARSAMDSLSVDALMPATTGGGASLTGVGLRTGLEREFFTTIGGAAADALPAERATGVESETLGGFTTAPIGPG